MPDYYPDTRTEPTPVATVTTALQNRRAEAAVARHARGAWVASRNDQADSFALADAVTTATEEELDFFDYGMAQAGESAVKQQLVLNKVELFSSIDNRRIRQRFGR